MKPKICNKSGCNDPKMKKPGNTSLYFRYCQQHQLEAVLIKVRAQTIKDTIKVNKERKQANKSIQALIQEARKPFQQWIRIRDANFKCISCGEDSETWDAGHFKKAELYSGLIFDERNVWKQCRKCNKYLNGNEGEYRKRLIERFGQEWMDILDDDAIRLKSYKWEREELKDIKLFYLQKLKQIYKHEIEY